MWVPTFFSYTKLDVKNFSEFFIYRGLWTLDFSQGGFWAPTVYGHTKFEVKNFLEFFS